MTADLRQTLMDALSKTGRASSDYDLNKDVDLPQGRKLTPASVLIAVRVETGTVILTKRSAKLKHHPGQIAFAGGKQDADDADAIAAALREAREAGKCLACAYAEVRRRARASQIDARGDANAPETPPERSRARDESSWTNAGGVVLGQAVLEREPRHGRNGRARGEVD